MSQHASRIFAAAVDAVRPSALLAGLDLGALLERAPQTFGRVAVMGAGKAAMATAGAVEPLLGGARFEGFATVPHGYPETFPASERAPARIEVTTAGHPVPDETSARAGRRALALAGALGPDDLLLVLLSGGGSALWSTPAAGLTPADLRATTRLLLASGADIHAVNAVRRHLTRLGGGRLARAAAPAAVLTLALSDVVGDDPAVIASGPTVPDPTTFADAAHVLETVGVWDVAPEAVRQRLAAGRAGELPETPKPGEPAFERAVWHLVGSNADARAAAAREAERLGYRVVVAASPLTGEAREVGRRLARELLDAATGTCLVWGGETTVTVTGDGRGGRNQELALAAALEMDGASRPVALLSGGTDGIDGPTDAAGAWATPETAGAARARGIDPAAHLARNDAYPLFDALGQLLRPGPTHTNVMDIVIGLAER